MKKVFMSLLVITGLALSGLAAADESQTLPVPKSAFEESITVTFAGMEEALQSATTRMIESQIRNGLDIAMPNIADLATVAVGKVVNLAAH